MNHHTLTFADIIQALRRYWALWLLPMIIGGVISSGYAITKKPVWEAKQTMAVRKDAIGSNDSLGRFHSESEIQSVQETLVELVRNRRVLESVLEEVDGKNNKISNAEISGLRDVVGLTPPSGNEFGNTEVFYLKVKAGTPDRATKLTAALGHSLDEAFRTLRIQKAESVIAELQKNYQLAQESLDLSTNKLTEIEKELGSDLPELRAMLQATSGTSSLNQLESEIKNELRQVNISLQSNEALSDLLKSALDDPGRLLAAPNTLLESQPALSRLKDGLVDAQIQTAQLKGRMSNEHPLVLAAIQSEEEIGRHLHDELKIAVRGIKTENQILSRRRQLLENRSDEIHTRFEKLAALRASYLRRNAEIDSRIQLSEDALQELASAKATLAAITTTSPIVAIDRPDPGITPIGPRKSVLALLGVLGGLGFGLALIYLIAQPVPIPTTPSENLQIAQNYPNSQQGAGNFTCDTDGRLLDNSLATDSVSKKYAEP